MVNKKVGCSPGEKGEVCTKFDRDHLYVVSTSNFLEAIPRDKQAVIYTLATANISPETDFIVFDPNTKARRYEDQGRTMKLGMPSLKHKVYAKLDDYGSKETLSEQVGHPVRTQYALTIMLAEDY
jgi:hypothetical protein